MLKTVHDEVLNDNEDQDDVVLTETVTDFEINIHDGVLLSDGQPNPRQNETVFS